MSRGRIEKALSGFYYVNTGAETLQCRARGKFRREGMSPLVGDWVQVRDLGVGEGFVETVEPRRNVFSRPAAANIDQLVILASAAIPVTEPYLIDRIAAIAALKGCQVLLCLNKCDLNTADELYDIYAFRVIVDSIPDCYNVLGHIHDLFNLIPGRFKDYISTPKPNMYQSLHTTVIGSQGIPFEVQIRTWEMHETAEYGIAAHWKYKQGTGSGTEKDFEWVRRLLESQQDADAEEYVQSLKIDMFNDVPSSALPTAPALEQAIGTRRTPPELVASAVAVY